MRVWIFGIKWIGVCMIDFEGTSCYGQVSRMPVSYMEDLGSGFSLETSYPD
jgi:hypothetical protein